MSFDGSFLHAVRNELDQQLTTGRISKINQPYPNELILTIRAHGKSQQLLLSANPTYARVQITQIHAVNPDVPSNFTMLIRKYLNGAILKQITQPGNDRVLHFDFTSRNEIGDQVELRLIIEIMARHSNIILIDQSNNKIIDSIKRVNSDVNRYRTLLPGSTYINPPKQDVLDPFNMNDYQEIDNIVREYPNVDVLADQLRNKLQGLGKDTSLALASYLHRPGDLANNFSDFFNQFDHPTPTISEIANNKYNYTAFPYPNTVSDVEYSSLSELLDQFYHDQVQRDRVREKGSVLIHVVKNQLKKNRTKLKKLQKELAETDHADQYRIKGEILTTYLNQVQRGMTEITLTNFYAENEPIKISLSNQISPSENAQKYFKRYQKLKNAISYLSEQIKETNSEISYFENIQAQIELANPEDLQEIRYELEQQGYLRNHEQHQKNKKKRHKVNKPEKFIASDGTEILVGKNNLQNEQLTLHFADKRDTWLHVKDLPGSHVIIRSFDPSEQTLLEAANLAAYFSKARESTKVPVDYVKVRAIKKPNGTKPGFVIYEGQTNVLVDPDPQLIKQLRQ
ncbi:fibronectin-binding A domain-containing protein [Lentilactobacillus senioris DSM 24302 = JCM 17472]|uniref:Rqc2 homolog RqcH n=1 Tax=Lentilactobacillus senioris DSM 24302 = JCM 17472 TaxID=1423802 RepID=A0A0R2CQ07_9LACO|nr:NFACT RNA binding domain-containing protein [Lentilactobacillus senioris]KRM93853.1 fibronectin-binding A domain-containing protein [Lentilactobacillus senioris DSM 24302 = JCM 17472]